MHWSLLLPLGRPGSHQRVQMSFPLLRRRLNRVGQLLIQLWLRICFALSLHPICLFPKRYAFLPIVNKPYLSGRIRRPI